MDAPAGQEAEEQSLDLADKVRIAVDFAYLDKERAKDFNFEEYSSKNAKEKLLTLQSAID